MNCPLESSLRKDLTEVPVVALLGPRQCGKTKLAFVLCADSERHRIVILWNGCRYLLD